MSMKKKKQRAPQTVTTVKNGQKLIINQIVVRPIARQKTNVSDWRTGLQSADLGRVKKLFDLEEDLLIDGFLSDAIGKRIDAVTNAELTFQDANGQGVQEVFDLLDTPAWEDLLNTIMQQRFWGRSGVELDFSNGFDVKPIPPKHINLEIKQILLNEYDDSGVPYEGDDHLLVLGKPRDFGLLLRAAPFAIYKRGAFGDYAQWLEIFGMPQRIGKYSSYDPESRKLLEQAFEQAGSAPFLVIPKESEVETTSAQSHGAGQSPYDEFRKACNEEMLITILGQTMTTVQGDKGARSLGEVHKEVEEGKNKSDMRFVQRVLNHYVLPMLEKRGFPVTGGKFIFPKAAEALSVTDIVQLAGIMDIPLSHLHDKYSIPVPKDGEPVAGEAKAPDPANAEPKPGGTPPSLISDPPAGGKDRPKKPKKEIKNADHGLGRRLKDFFVNAPLEIRGAIRNLILSDQNKVTQIVDVSALFSRALKEIYRFKGIDNDAQISERLFRISNAALQHAIDTTFSSVGSEWGRKNLDFIEQFKSNTAVFSAFKNHAQSAEIAKLLYRPDGSVRSFSEFKKEALLISEGYNKTWLQAEYNTAIRAARMAVNWKKFQETKHLYPNLEYMPSRAAKPRDSHKELYHLIWAIDDPIWDIILPPSDWNCLCSVRATDKPVSELPPEFIMPKNESVFRNNPGKTAQMVNTDQTEYYKATPERFRDAVIQFAKNYLAADAGAIIEKYVAPGGGWLKIVRQNSNEAADNIATYKILADKGEQYTLITPISEKSPDALNEISGILSDAKYPVTSNGANAIQNSIKEGSKQKVGEVIIRLRQEYTHEKIYEGLKAALQNGRASTIKRIVIIDSRGKLEDLNADKLRKYFQK